MNPESKRPISIEDLLRVKRAERPPAEFWTEFDRQLRAKQLAALVAKRPWWQSFPKILGGFSRYHIPLGATAALAVTFISVRHYQNAPEPVGERAGAESSPATVAVASPSIMPKQRDASAGTVAEHVVVERSAKDFAAVAVDSVASVDGDSGPTTTRGLSGMIALLGTAGEPAASSELSAPRYAASSLTVEQNDIPVLSHGLLGPTRGFEGRVQPVRVAVEPLQQITPPSERTRAKLLTAMLSMTSTEAPARSTDRTASKLSEERLYDQIHRFDARGAGVRMKF